MLGLSKRLIVIAWCCPTLMGCAAFHGFPDPVTDEQAELASYKPYLSAAAISAYDSPDASARNGLSPRQWRNKIIDIRIRAIDIQFDSFERELYREGIGAGVGTDWATLALNGAAAFSPKGTADILSALSAGLIGARASFDKRALYNKAMPALMAQMVARRKQVLVTIRQGLARSAEAYSLQQALSDVDDYYRAGTIPGAIAEVASNAGAEAKTASAALKDLKLVRPVPGALQSRREAMAAYIKTLPQDRLDTLAEALGKPAGDKALLAILYAISDAQTASEVDAIAQKIQILDGKVF